MAQLAGSSDATIMPRVLAHYHRVAPLIAAHLAGSPIVYKNYPAGLDSAGHFGLTDEPLTANALLHDVHAKFAIEFYTWAPLPKDIDRLRFARILLEPDAPSPGAPPMPFPRVRDAAFALRDLLGRRGLQAVALLDGGHGIALWVPLADAPHALPLRTWLHALCNEAAIAHPELVTTEPNTHRDGRVHLHVSSDAPHRYSAVPYSLRAQGMTVCTPVTWEELASTSSAAAFGDGDIPARLAGVGDVFAGELAKIGEQTFAHASAETSLLGRLMIRAKGKAPRGVIVNRVIELLMDGKARDIYQLLEEGKGRKLFPATKTWKALYADINSYIERQTSRNRKPRIVEDWQHLYRINEPPDDWPDLVPLAQTPPDPAIEALCARLTATGRGEDTVAFEVAVCDAFARLGFKVEHTSGHTGPDGIADAILGSEGYRVLLEAKTAAGGIVTNAHPVEVAKFRDTCHAQHCVMVGPAFPGEFEISQELQTHQVTAFELVDLLELLRIRADPYELRAVLAPGFASDGIFDLQWQRLHGAPKRITTIAYTIVREGWKTQELAAAMGDPANAPVLNVDSAMLLFDKAMRDTGSVRACARGEVEEAIAWLCSPNVGKAVRNGDGIVVLRPYEAP